MATDAGTVRVCNLSLLSIGARAQISSLSEGSTEANACSTLFAFVFEMLARAAYWNCLRQQATLSLLAAAQGTPENPDGTTLPLPPDPWLYSYALPSDSLQARYIVPSFPATGGTTISPAYRTAGAQLAFNGQIPFHVAYGTDNSGNPIQVILTNQTQAQLVYTVNQPNPIIWDSMFLAAMVSSLSAYLVPALSLNLPLMQASVKAADSLIGQARARDGNEGSTSQDHIPDWIRARGIGGYAGYGDGYSTTLGGYGDMAWPG